MAVQGTYLPTHPKSQIAQNKVRSDAGTTKKASCTFKETTVSLFRIRRIELLATAMWEKQVGARGLTRSE